MTVVEAILRKMAEGKAEEEGKTKADFSAKQLAAGRKVEMEHTADPRRAERITMDHLTEHPGYYPALKKMEAKLASFKKIVTVLALHKYAGGAIMGTNPVNTSKEQLPGKTDPYTILSRPMVKKRTSGNSGDVPSTSTGTP